ncbi:mechanosensitive ion channel family protein [Jatrophihabitans telluris]|uniref:Mechanosensitive ion channel family protein n=1 Tax=Jatrophihabitans telluris TaxID=2038343 RepID=A0ABY4R0T5_9ACTN|nr:mechanosensitive ion channel family protein [Jatrophihabitans telluris]UQX88770.1 mechanosensitive ion channel family protein [Jatrophihabitans telluris]
MPVMKRGNLWIPRSAETGRPLGTEALLSLEARIKPDFKRAVGLGVLAVICLGVGDNLGGIRRNDHWKFLVIGLTVGFAVLGASAVRSAGRETFRVSEVRGGPATASALRLLVSVLGYGVILLGILQLLNVNLGSLLVGGAVTGVVVGIAAQQSLGNFFAGLVLMFARPYVPGQRVIVRSGALGGPFEGVITDAGLLYSTIETDDGPINLPNGGLLAAAVGPAPDRSHEPDPSPDAPLTIDPQTGVS